MKTAFCLLAISLLLAACSEKTDQPPAKTATNTNSAASGGTTPATAPGDYLGAMVKAQQSAVKTIDVGSLDKAIQMFEADKGRNPKDLDELVKEKFIARIPDAPNGMKIVYDANAGTVKVVPK
jgi:hypothetical protein